MNHAEDYGLNADNISHDFTKVIARSRNVASGMSKGVNFLMKKNKINDIPIVVGGIIPPLDEKKLIKLGVKAVFTPKNFQIEYIMNKIINIISSVYVK